MILTFVMLQNIFLWNPTDLLKSSSSFSHIYSHSSHSIVPSLCMLLWSLQLTLGKLKWFMSSCMCSKTCTCFRILIFALTEHAYLMKTCQKHKKALFCWSFGFKHVHLHGYKLNMLTVNFVVWYIFRWEKGDAWEIRKKAEKGLQSPA